MASDVDLAIGRVAAFLEEADELRVCSWLLVGFVDHRFDDFLPADEVPIREQLKSIYVTCSAHTQEKCKRAIARAIAEWDGRAHGPVVLRELALLAAETRASAAIPALRAVLDHHKLHNATAADQRATTSSIIAVIGGFIGIDDATAYLRKLFFSPAVRDEYRAQLFVALCEASPGDYPSYVPRFVEAMRALGDYFVPDLVFRRFVRAVGFDVITSKLELLEPQFRRVVLDRTAPIFYEMRDSLAPDTQRQFYRHLSGSIIVAAAPKGRFSADRGFTLEHVVDEAELLTNVTDISGYLRSSGALDTFFGALADDLPPPRPIATGTSGTHAS